MSPVAQVMLLADDGPVHPMMRPELAVAFWQCVKAGALVPAPERPGYFRTRECPPSS